MQELDGHVAIVVGGTKNLGLEVARQLAARGSVVAIVSRTPGDAQRVAAILAKAPGAAQGFCADVRDQAAIEGVVQSVYSRYGNISILVNCATARAYKSVADTDLADWESVISTNLTGAFVSCKAVLPYMLRARYGRIVNVASRHGLVAAANRAAYCAAKAGVIQFSKALAIEVAPFGVTVNVVAPGLLDTPAAVDALSRGVDRQIPVGRLGRLTEVSAAVCFLASPESGYVTGAVLPVDGGWSAGW